MNKLKFLIVLIIVLNSIQFVSGQSPKHELRATWLTTVWRLDWPSVAVPKATGTNDASRQAAILQQKNDLISILNSLKSANMNAVFFQVRSMCDAMYQSSYEPWSSFISSERGADPGYDPLAFAIEESHKRGIELHAWLNPYRYSTSSTTHGELPADYYNTHPDWLLAYDSYTKILNPGMPEVVLQIKKIIGEIIKKYDVDGIVFDDYFYAYGGTSTTLDAAAQALYKPAGKDLGDWRRENVNRMIAAVYDTIQTIKPYVTFGVSPFGTWTTDATVAKNRNIVLPSGVGATGNMYAEIYCDPIAWLEQGKVDYISPQLYWTTYSAYPYGKLAPWWSNIANRFGKHFYSSHSLSAMTASAVSGLKNNVQIQNEEIPLTSLSTLEHSSFDRLQSTSIMKAPASSMFAPSEIGLQIDFNRSSDVNDAPGSVFYATANTVNTSGFITYLKQNKFTQPALCPARGWKPAPGQTMVDNISVTGQTLSWTYSNANMRFAVYAVPIANSSEVSLFASSKYLLGISYSTQFDLPISVSVASHKIAVSVLDRYGNEYAPHVLGENITPATTTQLIYPENNTEALLPCVFKWEPTAGTDSYIWQLATDNQFTDLVCSRETLNPQFFSGLQTNLKDATKYYWRVKALKPNSPADWSEPHNFIGNKFSIINPTNGTGSIPLTPTITWDSVSSTAKYTLEISSTSEFLEAKRIYMSTVQASGVTIPFGILVGSTPYYARVTVTDGIVQATSETVLFTTLDQVIPVPQISSPVNGAMVQGASVQVCWNEQASRGFRIELSASSAFPPRSTTVLTTDAYTYCVSYDNLAANTYYVQVKATTTTGLTTPSTAVSFVLNDKTPVEEIGSSDFNCYIRASQHGEAELVVATDNTSKASIGLYSLTGVQYLQKEINLINGSNIIPLDIFTLPQSIYIVKIQTDKNKKILKVRN